MAIEYLIEYDCPIKQKLTIPAFVQMLKQRASAEGILETEMAGGKSEEEARMETITWEILTPDGKSEVGKYSVGELLDRTNILIEMIGNCDRCPAAMGEPYGCHNGIRFPISARAEQWLASVANRSVERKDPGGLPMKIILDKKPAGEPFKQMRADPQGTYFELKRPVEIQVGKGVFGKKTANTDQVLEFMLSASRIHGSFLVALAFFSGGLVIQDGEPAGGSYQSAFPAQDKAGREQWWVYNLPVEEVDDTSTRQWKRFFSAVIRAYQLNTGITIEY